MKSRSRRRATINHQEILDFIGGLNVESPLKSSENIEIYSDPVKDSPKELIRSYSKLLFSSFSEESTKVEIAREILSKSSYNVLSSRTLWPEKFTSPATTVQAKRELILSLSPYLMESQTERDKDAKTCEEFTRCKFTKSKSRSASYEYIDIDLNLPVTYENFEKRYLTYLSSQKKKSGAPSLDKETTIPLQQNRSRERRGPLSPSPQNTLPIPPMRDSTPKSKPHPSQTPTLTPTSTLLESQQDKENLVPSASPSSSSCSSSSSSSLSLSLSLDWMDSIAPTKRGGGGRLRSKGENSHPSRSMTIPSSSSPSPSPSPSSSSIPSRPLSRNPRTSILSLDDLARYAREEREEREESRVTEEVGKDIVEVSEMEAGGGEGGGEGGGMEMEMEIDCLSPLPSMSQKRADRGRDRRSILFLSDLEGMLDPSPSPPSPSPSPSPSPLSPTSSSPSPSPSQLSLPQSPCMEMEMDVDQPADNPNDEGEGEREEKETEKGEGEGEGEGDGDPMLLQSELQYILGEGEGEGELDEKRESAVSAEVKSVSSESLLDLDFAPSPDHNPTGGPALPLDILSPTPFPSLVPSLSLISFAQELEEKIGRVESSEKRKSIGKISVLGLQTQEEESQAKDRATARMEVRIQRAHWMFLWEIVSIEAVGVARRLSKEKKYRK